MSPFTRGVRALLPIVPGILPFGAVMGASFSSAGLPFGQAMLMNTSVYAGAAQLATVDLMKLDAAVVVVVCTGLIINLRFLLYSAALSPFLRDARPWVKFLCAFTLTDQSYATMSAQQDSFTSDTEAAQFYLGTAACMLSAWQASVMAGYAFGNFAPPDLALDYAIPLSFAALLAPTLKTRGHRAVALFSSLLSLLLHPLPLRSGLMVTALTSIALAWAILRRRKNA